MSCLNRYQTTKKWNGIVDKYRLEKLSSNEDRGKTERVTTLPRPYALDIDL